MRKLDAKESRYGENRRFQPMDVEKIFQNSKSSQDKCISDQSKEAQALWRNFSYSKHTEIFWMHKVHIKFSLMLELAIEEKEWTHEIRGILMIY